MFLGSKTLLEALSPEHPTSVERDLVRRRVLDIVTPACTKRRQLAQVLGRAAEPPSIDDVVVPRLRAVGYVQQANEIVAARAFGAVLDRARDATAELTRAVEPGRGRGVPIVQLVRDARVRAVLGALRAAAKNFVAKAGAARIAELASRSFAEANSFAEAISAADDPRATRLLVARIGQVLGLADGAVVRGTLFRVVEASDALDGIEEGSASIEPDRTGRTFRIANLHALLRDAGQRGDA